MQIIDSYGVRILLGLCSTHGHRARTSARCSPSISYTSSPASVSVARRFPNACPRMSVCQIWRQRWSSPTSWRRKSLPLHASLRRARSAVLGLFWATCAFRLTLVVDQDVARCERGRLRTCSMADWKHPSQPSVSRSAVSIAAESSWAAHRVHRPEESGRRDVRGGQRGPAPPRHR